MQLLNLNQIQQIHGGLTEKQEDSLLGKAGGYSANAVLLTTLYCLGFLTGQGLIVGGVLAPIAKMTGTYLVYDNKDWVKEKLDSYYPFS